MSFISKKYRQDMRTSNGGLFLYDFLFNLIFIVFILPVINSALKLIMRSWGESYITNKNLLSFLSHPPTILYLIVTIFVVFLFNFWKMISMIQYCNNSQKDLSKKNTFITSFLEGTYKTTELVSVGNIMLPFYTVIQMLFMLTPVLLGISLQVNIPAHLVKGESDPLFIRGFIIALLIFISFLAIRGLFTIHVCVNEHMDFSAAMTRSKKLMKDNKFKILIKLFIYNVFLFTGLYLAYYIILFLIAIIIYLTVENSLVITVFLSIYSKANLYIALIFFTISYSLNLNLISTSYYKFYEMEGNVVNTYPPLVLSNKNRGLKAFILLLIVAIGTSNFVININKNTIYLKETLPGMQIVSHRGYSSKAPENTIPAIELAIQAHADYVEIDVQQTKDGVLVLLHDRNLRRTTGLNKLIYNTNYREIEKLDAGSWFGSEYAGTNIPTLEEVLEFCKGRINVSIDIKLHAHEENLEENLVALIEEYDFVENCFVSSFNYDSIVKIKKLNEDISTGYIMSPAYGDFYNKPHIDFLSVRATLVSRNIVERAHEAGKEVHVWTVNTRKDLERMKSLGVDYVVTDEPQLAKEVLFSNDTTDTFIEMLNKMSSY